MSDANKSLYTKGGGMLQIPYQDYLQLMEKVKEGQRMQQVKNAVMEDLSRFLDGKTGVANAAPVSSVKDDAPEQPAPAPEPVAEPVEELMPEPMEEKMVAPPRARETVQPRPFLNAENVPPIKADIATHFNKIDESGRLFNVFKQYYTCLNASCGGTVRVTLKDGFCSFWNYDAWEEFAFVDIFENQLRIAVNPRYTDDLKSLNLCEVPRLLATRHNLVCVQVDDLNNQVLEVMTTAFTEAEITVG